MMKCPECGTDNKDGAKFCKNCGNALNMVKMEPSYSSNNSNVKGDNKKLLLICGTIIICIAIIAAAFVMISNNGDNASNDAYNNVNEDLNNNSANLASDNSNDDTSNSVSEKNEPEVSSDIYVKYCDFYTGSSKSDKTYCSANIGTEHYGETYKIGVSYYRDGTRLNDGATATKTVDEEGFLHIYTSNAFEYYPDKATVDIYDAKGNFLTEETYYLETESGQQKFGH